MCFLCAISRWSRQVASKLPWLLIPFIIVCALSQLLPPNYRLEITSSRVACLGVLLMSLAWYEIFVPWISSWRARKSAVLRERKLIEALQDAKRRKEATRRCRNCLTAYKVQMPGSGKYVCTYCGHMSKRPVLEVAGNLANSRLATSGSGVDKNSAGISHTRGVHKRNGPLTTWYRAADRNHCAWFGKASLLADSCSSRESFPVLILKLWLFLWRKVLGLGKLKTNGCPSVNGTSEMMDDACRSRLEKARNKADKKKQARSQKELVEAEDRKQREEVASLVEERRRQRDELKILEQKKRQMSIEKEKERKKERNNDKQIDKSGRKSGKLDTTSSFDQGPEPEVGSAQGATKDIGDQLAVLTCSSKEQTNGLINISKSSRGSVQNYLSKYKTMDRLSRLGFLKRPKNSHKTSISASKGSVSPQCDNVLRSKKESTSIGKMITPSGCSKSSPGASGDTQAPASAWKRAPWISAWVKGTKELDLDRNSSQQDLYSNIKKSIQQDSNAVFDPSNNFPSINKPSILSARAMAIQPPIAPPSACADPLQQLFSTPSLFPPIDQCANVNHSSEQKPPNEAKHAFLSEHTFFEAQNFTQSTDMYMAPFGSSFIQPRSDKDLQTEISTPLDRPAYPNVVPECSLLSNTSSRSMGTEMSLFSSEKAMDSDVCTDNTSPWKNVDEGALQLPSLITVKELFDADLFASDASLVSPQKSEWEDAECSQKLPAEFDYCITQESMKDPIITADGHSYEHAAIEKWLKSESQWMALPNQILEMLQPFST